MPLPTFIVAGVAKAASTSLHMYLDQHPEVFMAPGKHTNYFVCFGDPPAFTGPGDDSLVNRESIHLRGDYERVFEAAGDAIAVGEASPRYMVVPQVPERIHAAIPDVKIVIALRHPVDRAYSTWMWNRLSGREALGFAEALEVSADRLAAGWGFGGYLESSHYAAQLASYLDLFGRSRVHVHLFEDFAADPVAVMQDLYAFIGVDPTFVPDTSRQYYPSGVMRGGAQRAWDATHRLRVAVRPLLGRRVRRAAFRLMTRSAKRAELDPELRSRLVDRFRVDVLETQELIGRDLSAWLE